MGSFNQTLKDLATNDTGFTDLTPGIILREKMIVLKLVSHVFEQLVLPLLKTDHLDAILDILNRYKHIEPKTLDMAGSLSKVAMTDYVIYKGIGKNNYYRRYVLNNYSTDYVFALGTYGAEQTSIFLCTYSVSYKNIERLFLALMSHLYHGSNFTYPVELESRYDVRITNDSRLILDAILRFKLVCSL